MYSFRWNKRTGGYTLVPQAGQFIASEIRPVFAPELKLVGFDTHFSFDESETRPICWAKQNVYIYRGEEIAKLEKTQIGRPLTPKFLVKPQKLHPVDIEAMLRSVENQNLMAALVADTQKRIKELYDQFSKLCEVAYIAFSGGKDSVLLLDLCHRTLPLSVPVVFSDTDMELPDTYAMWEEVQKRYPDRIFLKARANVSALENWNRFGPPAQTIRWCCTIHKSTPAILMLRKFLGKSFTRAQAYVGVRNDESVRRSMYEDVGHSVKNSSQENIQAIREWGAHELWMYTFANGLPINQAYKKGLSRVGCILCPESSGRHLWFVNALYPEKMEQFNSVVRGTLLKEFTSPEDEKLYFAGANWRGRRNGMELKNRIEHPEEIVEDSVITWIIPSYDVIKLKEWLLTLGQMSLINEEVQLSYTSSGVNRKLKISFSEVSTLTTACRFEFEDSLAMRNYAKNIRLCVRKAISCLGCRACEVECLHDALHITENGNVKVRLEKCQHCLQCHHADYGCWSFKSRGSSKMTNKTFAGMGAYQTFGLREDWVVDYLDKKETFSTQSSLGLRQIPSARTWFRQAGLMNEMNCEPTKLLRVAEMRGPNDARLWNAMWMSLVHRSSVVKWIVTTTESGRAYTTKDLSALLGDDVKEATKKSGLGAFRDMLTKSPFGVSEYPIVQLTMKGRVVETMTRIPHAVDDLALLYGLYLMAGVAEQSSFSISQLMTADFTAKYISPIVAFAMPVMTFQQQCQGLADRYSDFIQCNFTLGLDEITLKTDSKKLDDVVELMLQV